MRTQNSRVAGKVSNPQIQTSPPKETQMENTETQGNAENSNGADAGTVEKTSALKPIREKWLADGGKMPSAPEGEKLKAAYKTAKAAVEKADAEASAARKKLSDVCKVIMEKTGARTVTIDGVDHIPSVHGQSYFFRARGERTPAVSL